jgi:hypothetical protein
MHGPEPESDMQLELMGIPIEADVGDSGHLCVPLLMARRTRTLFTFSWSISLK